MTTINRCRDELRLAERCPEGFAEDVVTRLTWLNNPNARILIVCNRADITGYLKEDCPKWVCIDGVSDEVRQELLLDTANSVIIASDPKNVGDCKFDVVAVLTKEFAIDYYGEFSTEDGILFDFSPYRKDHYGEYDNENNENEEENEMKMNLREKIEDLWERFWECIETRVWAGVLYELAFWGLFWFATATLLRDFISFDVALWITLVLMIISNRLRWFVCYLKA